MSDRDIIKGDSKAAGQRAKKFEQEQRDKSGRGNYNKSQGRKVQGIKKDDKR